MATSQLVDIDKDLTTCPICFEQFTRPKHLPCLHSFCEGCLKTYITSALEKDTSITGVNCPVCRGFIPKPEDVTWDNWAESMLVNHFLTSIIDARRVNKENKTCDVCARENETESAVSWCCECREAFCKSCERQHRRFSMSSQHKITRLEDLPSLESRLFAADIFCPKHADRKLEAYCADHAAVCCLSCAMLEHRKCENVGTIEAAAAEKRRTIESENLEKSFVEMKSTLKSMEDKLTSNLQSFESSAVSIKSQIDSLIHDVTRHLETLKDNAVQEITAAEKEHIPDIQAHRDEIRCKVSAAENDMMVLQSSLKVASDAQFLVNLTSLLEQKTVIENYIAEQKGSLQEKSITFKRNDTLTEFSTAVKNFGKITVNERPLLAMETAMTTAAETKSENHLCSTAVRSVININMSTTSPKLIKEIKVNSCVMGVAFLPGDRILISKSSRKEIALLKVDGTILSSLKLALECRGLRLLGSEEGAVVNGKEGIQLFKIKQNRITKRESIDVPCHCDFAFRSDKFYIGGEETITVLNQDRNLERNISIPQKSWYLDVRADGSVCFSSGAFDDDHVYCVSSNGKQVFQYSHDKLKNVNGVTVDKSGNIYACGLDSKNIHQLTPDGELNRIILEDLPSGPVCISFNEDNHIAAVGCEDRLLLYQFS